MRDLWFVFGIELLDVVIFGNDRELYSLIETPGHAYLKIKLYLKITTLFHIFFGRFDAARVEASY